jgi:hypothetical protein
MFALRKDERKLQYSRSNVLGFINTGHFTSDNVPHGIKNATYNTFLNFRKSWLLKLKYPAFFGNGLTQITSVSFSMFVVSLKVFIMPDS